VIVVQNWQQLLSYLWELFWVDISDGDLALAVSFRAGAVPFTARFGRTRARIVAGSTGARPIPAALAGVTARLALASALSVLAAHACCFRHDEVSYGWSKHERKDYQSMVIARSGRLN